VSPQQFEKARFSQEMMSPQGRADQFCLVEPESEFVFQTTTTASDLLFVNIGRSVV
jgi:hypothetical protein